MSHQAVNWAIEQRAGGPSAKTVLWSIANYADENWCAWPSQDRISNESEQSSDTVQRRIRDLEMLGLVRRIRLRFAGRRSVNFYILKPSFYFGAPSNEIEPLFPRGYSIAPDDDAADCGIVDSTKTPVESAVSRSDDAANDAANDAATVRSQNLGTIEGGGGGVAPAREAISEECFEIVRDVGRRCGYAEPIDWPPKWSQAAYRVQDWLRAGWQRDDIVAAVTETMASKRDGPPNSINYFDKPIANWIARRDQPLPPIKPLKEVKDAKRVEKSSSADWRASRDNWRAAAAELGAAVDAIDGAPNPGGEGRS